MTITNYRAKKIGGSYQADGTIVSTFATLAGETRHVFEFDQPAGMLHIFGPGQVEIAAGAAAPRVVADEPIAYLLKLSNGFESFYKHPAPFDLASHGQVTILYGHPQAAPVQAQEPVGIAGLGRMTDEDDGYVTLQFKNEELAQDFMSGYSPSVDVRDMPPVAPVQPVTCHLLPQCSPWPCRMVQNV